MNGLAPDQVAPPSLEVKHRNRAKPPGGGGSSGPPGGGLLDPYLQGGVGSALALDRRRVVADTYWAIRRSSVSIRSYLSSHILGIKKGALYSELWVGAEVIDTECERAYRWGGQAALDAMRASSDSTEHLPAKLGAELNFILHGDRQMHNAFVIARPPESTDLLPDWVVDVARTQAQALAREAARIRNGGVANQRPTVDEDDDEEELAPNGARRRRRRAKAKAKEGGANANR